MDKQKTLEVVRSTLYFVNDYWDYFLWTAVMAIVIKQNGFNDLVCFLIVMGAAAYLQGRKDASRYWMHHMIKKVISNKGESE